ncbi:substrate-binding domain-containing protein [Rhodococcus sp. BP-349]|uniref:sugar ABC transporter substrate-binding protein n=1 Tax=unclassified Rhodococcus (in: high G+C Gram-positive bacteria) TaxID=192944 RepID=UPI001C9B2DA1|nr:MULTISPECIES: substrate-binding domain-containing protein [unclassified Rhodococcus (in: high G+C Gram-positive bacteria)]MBY6537787.1 substrate-binding domain-containing protein [Rhodococcus sp. BP-363]MBY6542124.1 substrate-binding domain-containing protein [Rhodococcus sp. BP-369]MBY6561354.1 substrate-binding domain-containing protein [Rhodococcus sp. BP-370]MBY6575646.1 substrate-binding domain-containing protein [Rhodococcus sp. BP-364]MBY6584947.1 substrate-binding domain-containing 
MRPTTTRKAGLIAAMTVCSLALAACGNGGSASRGSDEERAAVDVSAATAKVQELAVPSAPLGITVPIDKAIPSGLKVILVNCVTSFCKPLGDQVETAGEALGWDVSIITPSSSNAAAQQNAFKSALSQDPDMIMNYTYESTVLGDGYREAFDRGIPVVSGGVLDEPAAPGQPGPLVNFSGPPGIEAQGASVASLVADRTEGHANMLFVGLPAFPIIDSLERGMKSGLDEYCPDTCEVSERYDLPVESIGKNASELIVNRLRASKDVDSVFLSASVMSLGMVNALKSAGLQDIKIFTAYAEETVLPDIKTGAIEGAAKSPGLENGWYFMDGAARVAAGVDPAPANSAVPNILVTADTLGDPPVTTPITEDFEAKFLELWGK